MILNEFTTTAMCRPEIIDITYKSFTDNILDINFKECTLYLNIDPAPNSQKSVQTADVARQYFGNVVVNYSSSCNFAAAVKWCFSQVKGKYFFHLEDDWILLKKIYIKEVIDVLINQNNKYLEYNKDYVSILLRAYGVASEKICLAPSVFCGDFARGISPKLDVRINPEEQMRSRNLNIRKTKLNEFSLRYPFPSITDIIVKDIGRDWIKKNGIIGDRSTHFVKWKKW